VNIVTDACPVIFLAKLNRLTLLAALFPGAVLVPEAVRLELERESIPQPERERLRKFLAGCHVVDVRSPQFPSGALSLADRCVLTLAKRHARSVILTDDALVRRVAVAEGLAVTGTLGLLIRARRAGQITRTAARQALDDLVSRHRFHISVELYQEALRQLG
jgi:hypothetical protein